jgi:hypothetical protein
MRSRWVICSWYGHLRRLSCRFLRPVTLMLSSLDDRMRSVQAKGLADMDQGRGNREQLLPTTTGVPFCSPSQSNAAHAPRRGRWARSVRTEAASDVGSSRVLSLKAMAQVTQLLQPATFHARSCRAMRIDRPCGMSRHASLTARQHL